MQKNDFTKQVLNIIFATDADGFPLRAHQKIAKLQILAEKYQNQQNKK
jgi:hypothetical protein